MMRPERWRQIDRVLDAALEREPDERAAFLDEACAGDEELRREVESLLRAHERAGSFIEEPPAEAARELLGSDKAALVGRQIGRYQISAPLGVGGMGEVYRARDMRLGREVAIKVLPAGFSNDTNRLQRFEQEACAASRLNHPNICTIHEVGETDDGHHYIVIEYVEGETLRHHLLNGNMQIGRVLDVGVQMASALAAAHSAGIIHRDIKPENVMLRRDGLVKVLDFGLAKLFAQQSTDPEAKTKALIKTRIGMVMGTVAYMSPEQARGLEVDERTDIWSLGVVLYEMIVGRAPFEGPTQSDVIASILKTEAPPLSQHAQEAPADLERVVRKALRSNKEERYWKATDLHADLTILKHDLGMAGVSSSTTGDDNIVSVIKRHKRGAAVSFAILVVAIAGVIFLLNRLHNPQPATTADQSLRVTPFTSFHGSENKAAFSPDGNQVAFSWDGEKADNSDIYVKLVGADAPLRLTTNPALDTDPTWSPDGRHIAFYRQSESGAGFYLVPALGGPERKLSDASAYLPPWVALHWQHLSYSPDGSLLAIADQSSQEEPFSIFLLSPETGERRKLTSGPAKTFGDFNPVFSPDGKTLAFARFNNEGVNSDLYVVPLAGGEPKRLTSDNIAAGGLTWTPDGREILFHSSRPGETGLWRIAVADGTPERVVATGPNAWGPAFSRQGNRLAYTQEVFDNNVWRIELSGSKRRAVGPPLKIISSTQRDHSPSYSPDGKRIVFASNRTGSFEIWVCLADGSNAVQLTNFSSSTVTGTPRWSPDGKWIAFDSRIEGNADVFVVSAEGGRPRRLTTDTSGDAVPSWSRDGRWIYFSSNRSGSLQIWKTPAEGGEAQQVTKGGGFEGFESTDGQYIYYTKRHLIPGIWRVPAGGGEETMVLDHHRAGYWRSWALVEEGIYFTTSEVPARTMIEFYDFVTGEVREVAQLERTLDPNHPTLAVSPDGRWLLYAQIDQVSSDIMLVENFR